MKAPAMALDNPGWLEVITGAFGGAATTFLAFRKRFSQDSAAIAQDKVETSFVATLMAERDMAMKSAREAWDQRTQDARDLARLEALLEASERETKRLRDELFSLRLHVRKLTAMAVRLDPQAAQLLNIGGGDPPDGIYDGGPAA